jgi:hypothetical protein
MKLEIKHLAPYLPYDLSFYYESLDGKKQHSWVLSNDKIDFALQMQNKPILRHLSDLDKELFIDRDYGVIPRKRIDLLFRNVNIEKYSKRDIELNIDTDDYSQHIDLYNGFLIMQILFEYHFDVFGLIDAGLAIDINTLKTDAE